MKLYEVIVLLLLFTTFAAATIDVHDFTLDTTYPRGKPMTGEINLTVDGESVDTLITTNKGHSALLYDLLKDGLDFSCQPYDCKSRFAATDSGGSLSFSLSSGQFEDVGFVVTGPDVVVTNIDFDLASTFGANQYIPLRIQFFDDVTKEWTYDLFSSTAKRSKNYGDYNVGLGESGPLIGTSTYCSQFALFETNKVSVGLILDETNATGDLEVVMYTDLGSEIAREDYNPAFESITIDALNDDIFTEGLYYVCVTAKDEPTGYRLYSESSSGRYRGFSFGEFFDPNRAVANKTVNYGISVAEYMYADSSHLPTANFSKQLAYVNDYLDETYLRDCTNGCSIPLRILAGVNQQITISNVRIDYTSDYIDERETTVYSFEKAPALMSYSGLPLDFGTLKFLVDESDEYSFYIDGEKFDEFDITVTPAPLVTGIYPTVVPAGIESLLFAELDYAGDNSSLSYEWNFGDGSRRTTTSNEAFHLFSNISKFTVTVDVSAGNLSSSYEQEVETIPPRDYVAIFYNFFAGYVSQVKADVLTYPAWQQKALNSGLNIVAVEDQLSNINTKIERAIDDEDYLEIAGLLNLLDVPRQLYTREEYPVLHVHDEEVNFDPLTTFTSESLDPEHSEDEYINAIALWRRSAVSVTGTVKKVAFIRSSGATEDILTTYLLSFTNDYPRETYLVLDVPKDELYFSSTFSGTLKDSADATVIPLDEGTTTLEFFLYGDRDINFYVAPAVSDLDDFLEVMVCNVESGCEAACNFNYVCEDGENYKTCRTDCKPVGRMILFIILAFLLGIILYTFVQLWYDKYYERTLFPDNNRLYNLMVFVIAAQNKGMSVDEIKSALREKGWTNERITFVIKKANGQRTGMYELIPFSKISAVRRKKDVKERFDKPETVLAEGFPSPHSRPKHLPPRKLHPLGLHSHGTSPLGPDATNPGQQNQRNINKGPPRSFNTRR